MVSILLYRYDLLATADGQCQTWVKTFASGLLRFPTVIDAHNGTLQHDWPGLG